MSERLDLDQDGERTEAVPAGPSSVPAPDDERPADPAVEEVLEAEAIVPADEQEVPFSEEP